MVRANCESRGVGTPAQIEETCDRAAAQAAAWERQQADEREEQQRGEETREEEERAAQETLRLENERRKADERAQKAADDVKIAQAKQALVACQAHVDQADFKSASDCWNDHTEDWALLRAAGGQVNADRMTFDVPTCLAGAAAALSVTSACMAIRETSDDDVIEKAGCLAEYERSAIDPSCGLLDMKVPVDRLTRLDLAKAKVRVDVRAAPIIARRERIAAADAARLARVEAEAEATRKLCRGPNVMAVLQGALIGEDLDPTKMRRCVYEVVPGHVATTTRDGWVIVTWGQSMSAAFKMSRAYADNSFFRTDDMVTFTGVRAFNRVDGGTATMPTFRPNGQKRSEDSIWTERSPVTRPTPQSSGSGRVLLPRGWTTLKYDAVGVRAETSKGTCKVDEKFRECTVCRDTGLAFPCMKAMFENTRLVGASFELSKRWKPADAVKQLVDDWGSPAATAEEPVSTTCWNANSIHAALMKRPPGVPDAGTYLLMISDFSACRQPPPSNTSSQSSPPQSIPPQRLEANRISGDKMIVPSDETKAEIQRSGKDTIIGSFKLCVTVGGDVSSIKVVKSTGFAAYDAKIQAEIQNWRYRPYEVDGRAVPVCTAATFIYSQK